MSISRMALKILWAQSGGICAFPGCNQELICKTSKDIIGHICHIEAQSPNGPRGNPNMTRQEIDSEENLILLCPTHHRIVDTDVETYTVEKLCQMKAEHMINIYEKIHTGKEYNLNFSQLYYMNIPRIAIIAAFQGIVLEFDFMEQFSCLHKMGLYLNRIMLDIKDVMQKISIQSVPLSGDLSALKVGQTIEFTEHFRTKNMPSLKRVLSGSYTLEGSLEKDPHLYLSKNKKKLILTLDPVWMTTSTSFANFSSGWVTAAGLASVKQITDSHVIAAPYLLGVPRNPWDDLGRSGVLPRTLEIP